MKIVVLNGSPRVNGNTAAMTKAFAEGAAEAGHEVEIVPVAKLKIAGCLGCEYCHTKGGGKCVQKDDMPEILEKIRKADRLTIFSPIYWWQVTAQTKLILDRLYPISEDEWKGKVITVVMNGAAEDDDKEFELLKAQFQEMADYIHADLRFLGVGTEDDAHFEKSLEKVKALAKEA